MDLKDTMYAIVYGEIIFSDTSADIQRVVGFLEVPVSYTDEVIDMVDKMGYDYMCLQQATHLESVHFCGNRHTIDDLYTHLIGRDRKKELRVYAVDHMDFEEGEYNYDVSDERFIELAEKAGTVWSLKGFQNAFNSDECPSPYDSYIRIIEVEVAQ